jgi:uncharacterized protein with GYD domain
MATYIGLACFTDQGIKSVKDTVKRAEAARELAKKFGVDMKDIRWTLGHYDIVSVCEANDEASMVAFSLAISSAGNVKFETLRALDRDEMAQVLQKMP